MSIFDDNKILKCICLSNQHLNLFCLLFMHKYQNKCQYSLLSIPSTCTMIIFLNSISENSIYIHIVDFFISWIIQMQFLFYRKKFTCLIVFRFHFNKICWLKPWKCSLTIVLRFWQQLTYDFRERKSTCKTEWHWKC